MKNVDPYKLLAASIITSQPLLVIKEIVAGNKKIIIDMLKDECRMLDWRGPIIDTLYADLSSVQDAMWLRQKVEGFANVLIERFDFERLVKDITYLLPNL